MSDEPRQPAGKKIIVDEDWKTHVEREKESAAQGKPDQPRQRMPAPPANISFLFTTLATQALIALGLAPNPLTQKTETDPDQAKHFIDMLGVLEEKTRNNLTPDEQRQLDALLFELRLHFVECRRKGEG
jgi:hypothetical protein